MHAGMKRQVTAYPPGYITNLNKTYQQHHETLAELAQGVPSADDSSEAVDLMEYRLLKSQDTLLELAGAMKIESLEDVSDLLALWHQVAIKDVSPYDVSLADGLVLAIHTYMTQQQPA